MDIDTIGIGVATRQVKAASKDLDKLGRSADKASRKADRLSKSTEGANKNFQRMGVLLKGAGLLLIARQMVRMSDSYTKYNAILRIATRGQEEFNKANKAIIGISKRSQAELGAIGTVYSRIALALKDFGATGKEVANITEALALSLKVNGATAEETTSTMIQLSQAFGKGKLDGDEFRTAMEAAPNIMRELAKSLRVPFGALKDLAEQGEITSEVLLKTFNNPVLIARLREQAKETKTINGAWQTFTNGLTIAIGKINEASGASRVLIGILEQAAVLLSVFRGGEDGSILRNFLDTGDKRIADNVAAMSTAELKQASNFYGWAREALKARQELNKNLTLGGSIAANDLSPRFGSEIVAQDVNKIHQLQDDARRIADRLNKQRISSAKEAAAAEFSALAKIVEARDEMLTANSDYAKELAKEEYETKKKWIDLQQKRATENFKLLQKRQKQLAKDFEKRSESINRSITDALLRGFESGKGFAENFIDTLKNMFKTLVLQPVVKFLVDSSGISKVLAGIGGAFSGSASAGFGGSLGSAGSSSDLLGGLTDVLSGVQGSIVSSIESLGVFLSTGNGGLGDAIGGFLGQYASTIADVIPYAGAVIQLLSGNAKGAAFTAAGAAIGSIIPVIGTAFGAAIGSIIGSLVGGADYDRYGTWVYGNKNVGQDYKKKKQGIVYDKDIGAGGALNSINQQFSSLLSGFLDAFNVDQDFSTYSALYQRGKSKKSGGIFSSSLGGRIDVVMKDADLKAVYNALVSKVFGVGLVRAIQNSDLEDGIKKFFNGLTKKQDVADAISAIINVKNAIKDLPPVFKALQTELDTTAFSSSASQLTARFNAVSEYTKLFYSDQEKLETITKQLNTQFASLNQTLPASRDEFRALVDGIDVVDEASANAFYGLIALAPVLDGYYQSLLLQKEALNELADALDPKLFSTYADYRSGQANIAAGNGAGDYLARINNPVAMSEVMAQEIKQLRAENAETKELLRQISANTKYTAKTNKQWNGDGMPQERTY